MEDSQGNMAEIPVEYHDSLFKSRRRNVAPIILEEINRIEEKEEHDQQSLLLKHDWIFARLWYIGHITVLICSIISIILCLTRQVLKPWPRLFYRFTFVSIVATYSLSLFKHLEGSNPGFFGMLPIDTFQDAITAALSIVTVPHTIKLTPFVLLSALHVADTHSQHHSGSKIKKRIADELSEKLAPKVLRINAYLVLWLSVELIWDCILIRPGATIALALHGFLIRVRLMYSPVTQAAARDIYNLIDKRMVRSDTPKSVRELYIRLRDKVGLGELKESNLYAEDTDAAIDKCNIMGTIFF